VLRSLERYAPEEHSIVMQSASGSDFAKGYRQLGFSYREEDFNKDLRQALSECRDATVTFFCDDDVVYRQFPQWIPELLMADEQVFCHSLRLGVGNKQLLLPQGFPRWQWPELPRHDFGFPASVDGHTFRLSDVLRLIGNDAIEHPTNLETVMAMRAQGFAEERPYMVSGVFQRLVGVPVNRVSTSSQCPAGVRFPQSTLDLNRRWLAGERIVLDDVVDPAAVSGCHHEVGFRWEKRP
jgi:hypothetical protein